MFVQNKNITRNFFDHADVLESPNSFKANP